jgi:hypothetical protein
VLENLIGTVGSPDLLSFDATADVSGQSIAQACELAIWVSIDLEDSGSKALHNVDCGFLRDAVGVLVDVEGNGNRKLRSAVWLASN